MRGAEGRVPSCFSRNSLQLLLCDHPLPRSNKQAILRPRPPKPQGPITVTRRSAAHDDALTRTDTHNAAEAQRSQGTTLECGHHHTTHNSNLSDTTKGTRQVELSLTAAQKSNWQMPDSPSLQHKKVAALHWKSSALLSCAVSGATLLQAAQNAHFAHSCTC